MRGREAVHARTHKERMLAGEPYMASDAGLVAERRHARLLLREYNLSAADETERRRAILSELLGGAGHPIEIEPPFFCDYGYNITVGGGFYANFGCVILDCAPVRIGVRVLLGPGAHIYTATHSLDPAERRAGLEYALPVSVGDDVWIGGGAIIAPGVSIGEGTTIGAGSMVTKSVPPGVLAAGNPCRVIRELR